MARVKGTQRELQKGLQHELQSGPLSVGVSLDEAGALREVALPKTVPDALTSEHLANIIAQLRAFPRVSSGPPFWERVWKRMSEIPWGSALTYRELAKEVGRPGASRAVGQACARNPLPLIVPCHRVLAETGLGGFAFGEAWKSALLALETEPLSA